MNSMELSLVLFTVLAQMAVGLTVMSTIRQWAVVEGPGVRVRSEWLAALVLLVIGVVAGLFHVGHWASFPRMLTHLSTSWLSREALSFLVFGLLVAVALVLMLKQITNVILLTITAAVGLWSVFVSGMVYSPPSFTALNNLLPFLFFLLTAAILGSSVGSYFAGEDKRPLLRRFLIGSLVVGLVVYLVVPGVWLSGTAVMEKTGLSYLGSIWYWLRIVVGLALPLVVVIAAKTIPIWVPPLLVASEIVGRIIFFSHTVHTSANIGSPY
jgi:DMSO reductase anchor subunit